jgi:hypothetical protein
MTDQKTLQPFPDRTTSDELRTERFFLVQLGLLYFMLSLLIVLALDRFWSANWDALTFLNAARSFWDGDSLFDLYEKSRAFTPWPYAYPPLFALVLAPFVWLADLLTGGPTEGWQQIIAMRLPILGADIAIAFLLHRILWRATSESWIGRLGAALWLFNPILFYHTAVQAHLESLWLWPALAAYAWLEERQLERSWWPMLLFVIAISIKQSALLYAVPFGLLLLWKERWQDIAGFAGLFGLIFGGLSLPFLLYSDDYRYMVADYVAKMPVQIQSWQVWTLSFERFLLEQTRTTFPSVRFAVQLTLLADLLLSIWALRKGRSWYAIGLMITAGFLLTAQKAMGYHYPILLPFLIAYGLRVRRYQLVSLVFLWSSWVLVSPYFAPWAEASHLPFYATLGTLNSIFYAWLLWQVMTTDDSLHPNAQAGELKSAVRLVYWMTLLANAFLLACLAHPLRSFLLEQLSDMEPAGLLGAMFALLAGLLIIVLITFKPIATWAARALALPMADFRTAKLERSHFALALLFVSLFFTWFTMNAEVTAVIEKGFMKAWRLN